MSLTINIRYTGKNGNALKFAKEMTEKGIVEAIRNEDGNLKYEYFTSLEDPETILLVDSWKDQKSLDIHHASKMMDTLAELRNKYDLHMTVDRYTSLEENEDDKKFIRS